MGSGIWLGGMELAYDCWNGELVCLGIFEQVQDVVADDNAGLARKNVENTHSVY